MLQAELKFVVALLLVTNVTTLGSFPGTGIEHPTLESSCQPLRVTSCRGLGYNETLVPNLLGMRYQSDSERALQSYRPLLQYGCSPELHIVLCGFYAPLCSPLTSTAVPPCRGLCHSVKLRCAPIMASFGYQWGLNCSGLPVQNSPRSMCMEGPRQLTSHGTTQASVTQMGRGTSLCPFPPCLCHGAIPFSAEDKEFASVWIAIWSVVCCGVTLFTLVSYML